MAQVPAKLGLVHCVPAGPGPLHSVTRLLPPPPLPSPLPSPFPPPACAIQLILNNYATILAVFKRYSTHGTISDVFNMQWNDFTDMAQDMQVPSKPVDFC